MCSPTMAKHTTSKSYEAHWSETGNSERTVTQKSCLLASLCMEKPFCSVSRVCGLLLSGIGSAKPSSLHVIESARSLSFIKLLQRIWPVLPSYRPWHALRTVHGKKIWIAPLTIYVMAIIYQAPPPIRESSKSYPAMFYSGHRIKV